MLDLAPKNPARMPETLSNPRNLTPSHYRNVHVINGETASVSTPAPDHNAAENSRTNQ
jgi:hypothetical protein